MDKCVDIFNNNDDDDDFQNKLNFKNKGIFGIKWWRLCLKDHDYNH